MEGKTNILSRIDWITVFLYLALVLFGWINIYSSVYNDEHGSIFDISQRYGKQMLWIVIAIVIAVGIFFIESHILSSMSYIIFGVMIFMLISVLFFGVKVHDSRSWFEIGSFRIQPAEFAKFALSLAVAKYISSEKFKFSNIENFLIITAIIALPGLLIILQNDTGSALVYSVFVLVLYREGLPFIYPFLIFLAIVIFVTTFIFSLYLIFIFIVIIGFIVYYLLTNSYIEIIIAIGILFVLMTLGFAFIVFSQYDIPVHFIIAISIILLSIVGLVWSIKKRLTSVFLVIAIASGSVFYSYSIDYIFNNILDEHHKTRINVLLGVIEDNKGAGYNVNQSKIAIGSGGATGKGFLKGTQTKYDFVPEQDTDFIFCTVGEEWGFAGTSAVIILFTTLIFRLIYLAEQQKSRFSRIYGYSVAMILFFHFGINIAMTIGLAPVIGIPLPFFSYGGSSLWAFTILLFMFLKFDTNRIETL